MPAQDAIQKYRTYKHLAAFSLQKLLCNIAETRATAPPLCWNPPLCSLGRRRHACGPVADSPCACPPACACALTASAAAVATVRTAIPQLLDDGARSLQQVADALASEVSQVPVRQSAGLIGSLCMQLVKHGDSIRPAGRPVGRLYIACHG
eukprot:COSAG01_NODE_6810_length_3487_cov_3.017414_3_plen_151_part_00